MTHRRRIDPKNLFDLTSHLYLDEIYRNTAQEIIVKKAAQLGLSEWLVSYTLHACDVRGMDIIYMMPTAGDVSDFSQARFGPALEASEYLDSIVVPAGGGENKRGADKVTLKRVRDSFIYFRGGQVGNDGSARQLKSVPADALVEDERDEIDPRAPEIARKRLGHSHIAEVRSVSTPSYPGVGIDVLWRNSDQREWHVPCPHCNHWQIITINHIVIEWDDLERPVTWHGQNEGRAYAACERCGKELNRLAEGRWIPTYPGRDVVGYHPTKLCSAMSNLLKIVQNLNTIDETKRRESVNQDLGECYSPRGGQLTDEIIDGCRRDYGHGPRPNQELFMGADVGKVIHVVVRTRPDHNQESEQAYAGEVDSFEELGRLAKRLSVKKIVIDALPETRKCREFQSSFPQGTVWLAHYADDTKWTDPFKWDEDNGIVTVDRTRSLDEVFSRFYDHKNTLPANARDIKDYYAHLKAPVRVLEEKKDKGQVARYIESGPDHLAHAENYCHAAMAAPVLQSVTVSRSVKVDL